MQELVAEMENTQALMFSQMRDLQSAFSLSPSCNVDSAYLSKHTAHRHRSLENLSLQM